MSTAKYIQIAERLKHRILNGDYLLTAIPGAPRLAEENGVSYLTARQAVQLLLDEGVLIRSSNGRLETAGSPVATIRKLNIANIRPTYDEGSPIWDRMIQQVAEEFSCVVRTVTYNHADDPAIFDALNGNFDLIFLQHTCNTDVFINRLLPYRERLVTLFQDLTAHGIRCLDGLPPSVIDQVIEHLYQLGHRRIDFMNTEPNSPVIEQRIAAWRQALKHFSCRGELYNQPVNMFAFAPEAAYELTSRLLNEGKLVGGAVFCTDVFTAQGCLRGCYEHGVRIPEDISVAAFGNPELARLTIPSLTVTKRPDPRPHIRRIISFYLEKNGTSGPLMYRPENAPSLVIGESTGPVPRTVKNNHCNKENKYAHA